MKASALEFRLRMLIQIVIVSVAMWAPWVRPWDIARRRSTLEWLAIEISRLGLAGFNVSTPMVIVFGATLAAAWCCGCGARPTLGMTWCITRTCRAER